MTKKITSIILWLIVGLLIIWDIIVAVESTPKDTISEISLNFAYNHPFIPFAIGGICGHIFWPLYDFTKNRRLIGLVILSLLAIIVLILDIIGIIPRITPIIPFLIGLICGHYGWPQKEIINGS